jgi:hypothetical protein
VFCTKCGKKLAVFARYCTNCGRSITRHSPAPVKTPTSQVNANTTNRPITTPQPTPNQWFHAKYWRGDFTLPFSYWVAGSIYAIFVAVSNLLLPVIYSLDVLTPALYGTIMLSFYCSIILVTIWWLAGTWRSADNHSSNGGSILWVRAAKASLMLIIVRIVTIFVTIHIHILAESVPLALGMDTTPPYEIRTYHTASELELTGGMPFGTARAIEEIILENPSIQIIHLNSQGGRINEAYKLYEIIETHKLSTYTSADCVSACSLAFLAGQKKYIGLNGRLGFHSMSIAGLGERTIPGINDDVRSTFAQNGLPESFISRALSTPPNDMWYPSKAELLEFNIIDSIADPRSFSTSAIPSQENILEELAAGFKVGADRINAAGPTMVDEETRLDRATAGPGALLTYHYTFPNYSARDIDPDAIESTTFLSVKNSVCASDEMLPSLQYGGMYAYHYSGNDGVRIGGFTVSKDDCDLSENSR